MGLFGKRKKEKYEAVTVTDVKNNSQEEFLKPVEKKAAPKAAAKPAEKKAAPKAEAKPAEKKVAPKAEAKPAEKKVAPKAEAKPAAKKAAPKAETKPVEKKAAPKADTKKASTKPAKELDEEPLESEIESAQTLTESKLTRNGNFEIKKAKDGRFFFNLCASNKVVIAYSQIYSSSTSAVNGIKSVIANAPKAAIEDTTLKTPVSQSFPKWEIYVDKAGKHRFRLYAPNGSCVCHSARGYATKATCKGGIESIVRFAVEDADVSKAYLK